LPCTPAIAGATPENFRAMFARRSDQRDEFLRLTAKLAGKQPAILCLRLPFPQFRLS
jgi:hypothetical protein